MLEDIRKQIEQLIARYEAEKAENERLRQELHASEETGKALRKQIDILESEIETQKLAQAFSGGSPSPETKAKVDTLIKEIDKCISYLERSMDQKSSVKIAGRIFNLTASTPEAEQLYREAAETINKRFAAYTRSHPGKNVSDLLSMIALNETVLRLGLQKDLDSHKQDEKALAGELERYLNDSQA